MDSGVAAALVVSAAALVQGFWTAKNNRRGLVATNKLENQRTQVEEKKVDLSVLQVSIDSLKDRLQDVEERLEHEHLQRRLSNNYARTLAQVLRDNGMPVPQPPDGLDFP